MSLLFDVVLVVVGILMSLVTVFKAGVLWVKETYDGVKMEAYSEEHDLPIDQIITATRLGLATYFTLTVLYWLALYERVFR